MQSEYVPYSPPSFFAHVQAHVVVGTSGSTPGGGGVQTVYVLAVVLTRSATDSC